MPNCDLQVTTLGEPPCGDDPSAVTRGVVLILLLTANGCSSASLTQFLGVGVHGDEPVRFEGRVDGVGVDGGCFDEFVTIAPHEQRMLGMGELESVVVERVVIGRGPHDVRNSGIPVGAGVGVGFVHHHAPTRAALSKCSVGRS